MKNNTSPHLDGLDLMLIRELEINARQTSVSLAKKLRISRPTIRGKLKRLIDDRIIKILPIADPLAMGFKTRVNLGFNTLPSEVDSVANALASHKDIHHVAIFTGRYDVMAWAVLENSEGLPDFVMKDLAGITGITRVETMVNLKMVKISYSFLSEQNHAKMSQPPPEPLNKLDLSIIRELRTDALQTQTDLAPKLKTSASTIRRRLQRLLDDEIIRVVAIPNPAALGYKTRATVGINVQPGRVDAVAQELSSFSCAHHVLINTGHFDVIISADFEGPEELSSFVREDLGGIQGLISHETMICLKTSKDDFTFAN